MGRPPRWSFYTLPGCHYVCAKSERAALTVAERERERGANFTAAFCFGLSVRLPVCLSACLPACLPVCLFVALLGWLAKYLSRRRSELRELLRRQGALAARALCEVAPLPPRLQLQSELPISLAPEASGAFWPTSIERRASSQASEQANDSLHCPPARRLNYVQRARARLIS